jgi:hypothetical protein
VTGDIYRGAASRYLKAGYLPVPIPLNSKKLVLKGATGWKGTVTPEKVSEWERTRPGDNVALVLPRDLVGLDVDSYKGATEQLAKAVQLYGALPPTMMSTSRSEGSGIRLYRIPNGTRLKGSVDKAIEIVQHHHRYVMAKPSIHLEGRPYRWIDEASGEVLDEPWPIDEIPDLPWGWLTAFSVTAAGESFEPADSGTVAKFISEHTGEISPGYLGNLPARISKIAEKKCRHDTLVTAVPMALREVAAGAYPAAEGLAVIRQWWDKVMDDPTRIDSEFEKTVSWAVAQVNGDPEGVQRIVDEIEEAKNQLSDSVVESSLAPASDPAPTEEIDSLWEPADLRAAINADPVQGRWLRRSDGVALLYAGKTHWIFGETEALKSWVSYVAGTEVIRAGGRLLILDFEDQASTFAERINALGIDVDDFADTDHVRFLSPPGPLMPHRLTPYLEWSPDLVIADGVTAALELEGLSPRDGTDIAQWQRTVLGSFARVGAAVVALDHVTKSSEGRGRYPIESVHKLNGVTGAAYMAEGLRPLSRSVHEPVEGLVRLSIAKDRPGGVRAHVQGVTATGLVPIADVHLTAYPDGGVIAHIDLPGATQRADLRPRIIEQLIAYPGSSKTSMRAIAGNNEAIDETLLLMIKAGEIEVQHVGQTHKHFLTSRVDLEELDAA